jgi:hypothetical protein
MKVQKGNCLTQTKVRGKPIKVTPQVFKMRVSLTSNWLKTIMVHSKEIKNRARRKFKKALV